MGLFDIFDKKGNPTGQIIESEKAHVKGMICRTVIMMIILMTILQGVRELAEYLISPMLPDIWFANRMLTMSLMVVLTVVLVSIARYRKQPLSVFPDRFSKGYIIASCIVIALYISTPANYIEGFSAVMLLIYGSIVTPVYEELLFRGYIWNTCEKVMPKKSIVLIWNIVLFSVWHMGYMIPHLISGNWNAVLWKLAAGLCYGTVLGFIRYKTGNCYSTILAHGVLNLFMI